MLVNMPTSPAIIPPPIFSSKTPTNLITSSAQLQASLLSAAPGDWIFIESRAIIDAPVGGFILPKKIGNQGPWITIASDMYSQIQGRATLGFVGSMPTILGHDSGPILSTYSGPGAVDVSYYRFLGINFAIAPNAMVDAKQGQANSGLIRLGDPDNKIESDIPHHFIIDRCLIQGDPHLNVLRGINLNCNIAWIVNSSIIEIHGLGNDSQAICGWNGPGYYVIDNNYLEAAGENIMFGGADPKIQGLSPSDIVISNNDIVKDLSWKANDPSYRGYKWAVKNLLELKNARRVEIIGNSLKNCWKQSQVGYALSIKSNDQDGTAPWSGTQDVEISDNVIENVGGGINLLGTDPNQSSTTLTSRIYIHDNEFKGISKNATDDSCQLVSGDAVQMLGCTDVAIINNTFDNDGKAISLDSIPQQPKSKNFVFDNNVVNLNDYGIKGSGAASGKASLDAFVDNYEVKGNTFVGPDLSSMYPIGNTFSKIAPDPLIKGDVVIEGNYTFDLKTKKIDIQITKVTSD